ncbi:hypothetical protein MIR68_011989 [Amoeboaphelidium protococcarum]|nr:hypothetical protein MIR68_011989 [Amoeboaphelidium protococcarum]
MFFTGEASRKRNVNLAGKQSQQLSRDEVLKRAQVEREKRMEDRRRFDAAIVIQKYFRSWSTLKVFGGQIMSKWQISADDTILVKALRVDEFLRFRVYSSQNEQTIKLNQILQVLSDIYYNQISGQEWSRRIGKLARVVLSGQFEMDLVQRYLKFILLLGNDEVFISISKSMNDTNLRTLEQLQQCSDQVVTDVIMRLISYSQSALQLKKLLQIIIKSEHLQGDSVAISYKQYESIRFGLLSFKSDLEFTVEELALVLQLLLLCVQIVTKQKLIKREDLQLFSLLSTQYQTISESNQDQLNESSANGDFDQVDGNISQMLSLLKAVMVKGYFVKLLTSMPINDKADLAEQIIALFQLISVDESMQDEVFIQLIYGSSGRYFSELYSLMRSSDLIQLVIDGQVKGVDVTQQEFEQTYVLLYMLCEMLSRLLLVYGSEEFYGEKNVFGLQKLVEFTQILKNLAFTLTINVQSLSSVSGSAFKIITIGYIKGVMYKLLNQIVIRDCQRQFCPDKFWIMTDDFDFERLMVAALDYENSLKVGSDINGQLSPYQQILQNMPYIISFENRVRLFQQYLAIDQKDNQYMGFPRHRVTIRRSMLLEDSFNKLNQLGSQLKDRVGITFISELGLEEAGIDGGGVFKEFLTTLCKLAFDPNLGLFTYTQEQLIYPNPHEYAVEPQQLEYFGFLGRIMGKALYEGILVQASFAPFFLNKWLGRLNYLDDLPSLDPELYRNLIFLKNYDGNVEDLSLTFSLSSDEFGTAKTVELIPNGKNIAVTKENRIRYIYLVAHYKLNKQIQLQSQAFFAGLSDLIKPRWLQLFNEKELHVLISGAQVPIDIQDLRDHTVYDNVYSDSHPTIQMFWRVLQSFSEDEKQAFVKFVTSCSRPPLLGFKELQPQFSIRFAGTDKDRLPTTSTCVNLLKLPPYTDEFTLRSKMLYAIKSGIGFELS